MHREGEFLATYVGFTNPQLGLLRRPCSATTPSHRRRRARPTLTRLPDKLLFREYSPKFFSPSLFQTLCLLAVNVPLSSVPYCPLILWPDDYLSHISRLYVFPRWYHQNTQHGPRD